MNKHNIMREEIDKLILWNTTNEKYPKNKSIYQLFEEVSLVEGDRIALVFENKQLSYGELNNLSNQLLGLNSLC